MFKKLDLSLQINRDKLLCTYNEVAIAIFLGIVIGFLLGVII